MDWHAIRLHRPWHMERGAAMKSIPRLAILILALAAVTGSDAANCIGTVRSISGDVATVAMNGDLMPPNGAGAEFFFKMAGFDDEISVGTGSVLRIDRGDLLVKIENATGSIESGQSVRFTCESSSTSAASSPAATAPPGLTESSASASTETWSSPTPTEAHRHFLDGLSKLNAREWQGALAAFNKALELDPNDAKSIANRATVYVELKQPKRALTEVNEAIRLNPNISMAYVIRGHCYSDLGQFKKAVADYDEAFRLDPKNTEALNSRGIVHILLKQTKNAIEDLSQAIALDPAFLAAYQNRAVCYKALGKTQLLKLDQARIQELKAAAKSGANPPPTPEN